jgi:mannose-6-phosphate isomerase class I
VKHQCNHYLDDRHKHYTIYGFSTREELEEHKATHTEHDDAEARTTIHPIANKVKFATSEELYDHFKTPEHKARVNADMKRERDIRLAREQKLKDAYKERHTHTCEPCAYTCHTEFNWNKHLKTKKHLQGKVSYSCETCKYKTNRTYDWNKHVDTDKHKQKSLKSMCVE